MENKEWNLSDKIGVNHEQYQDAILDEDVKEFIRRLKEIHCDNYKGCIYCKEIDKLAGEKLR